MYYQQAQRPSFEKKTKKKKRKKKKKKAAQTADKEFYL